MPGCNIFPCESALFLEYKKCKRSHTNLHDFNRCCNKCPHYICGCRTTILFLIFCICLVCVFKCVCLGCSFLNTHLRLHTWKPYYLGSLSIVTSYTCTVSSILSYPPLKNKNIMRMLVVFLRHSTLYPFFALVHK